MNEEKTREISAEEEAIYQSNIRGRATDVLSGLTPSAKYFWAKGYETLNPYPMETEGGAV